MSKKTTEIVQFKLLISQGLRRQLERSAKANGRSANGEAVVRLERSFLPAEGTAEVVQGRYVPADLIDLIKDTARFTAQESYTVFARENLFALFKTFMTDWENERKAKQGGEATSDRIGDSNDDHSRW